MFQKRRHQIHASSCVNSQPIFEIFSLTFSSNFAAKFFIKDPPHLICIATLPCETLMSENERQSQTNAVINNKLQGTVVTYLRCGGISNNQIKDGLLLSAPVKKNFNL